MLPKAPLTYTEFKNASLCSGRVFYFGTLLSGEHDREHDKWGAFHGAQQQD